MAEKLATGTRVRIEIAPDSPLHRCAWWPKGEVTGVVQKTFKNGKIAVAVDQIRNQSEDRKATIHFETAKLTPIES